MVRVVFVHPDLGIGGAERLVIDAAIALKRKKHEVTFITAHFDKNHCFSDLSEEGLNVVCAGDWLPRSTFGRFFAFWAYVRMIYVALYLTFFSDLKYEVLFVDQVSACIPILRLKSSAKIVFYCHFPDLLLTERKSALKKLYRYFLDSVEEYTTSMADVILTNSKFTSEVFRSTFKTIKFNPEILYPSFDSSKFQRNEITECSEEVPSCPFFLSLNRYERKKNIALAIVALHDLLSKLGTPYKNKVKLVVAGGYDFRVKENTDYHSKLVELVHKYKIQKHVIFLKSPSDEVKLQLLRNALCLLYTPSNEHFGIVPLEAMCVGTPVIAVNSGGPTETVVDGVTGFLMDPDPEAFSSAMKKFVTGEANREKMSVNCKSRVAKNFSFEAFSDHLDEIVKFNNPKYLKK